eukprot:2850999-Alexandrium_andersonii.AAC.1
MSASLVGSEMCIRDRATGWGPEGVATGLRSVGQPSGGPKVCGASSARAVSYTHLTLPTICSV